MIYKGKICVPKPLMKNVNIIDGLSTRHGFLSWLAISTTICGSFCLSYANLVFFYTEFGFSSSCCDSDGLQTADRHDLVLVSELVLFFRRLELDSKTNDADLQLVNKFTLVLDRIQLRYNTYIERYWIQTTVTEKPSKKKSCQPYGGHSPMTSLKSEIV